MEEPAIIPSQPCVGQRPKLSKKSRRHRATPGKQLN